MKKLILFTCVAISAAACNNNAKTEEQEKIERDSSDNVQISKDQLYVDSIMKAQEAQQSNTSSGAENEGVAPVN
mgnify:CR=1 FL=1|jgi:hypothetical protein